MIKKEKHTKCHPFLFVTCFSFFFFSQIILIMDIDHLHRKHVFHINTHNNILFNLNCQTLHKHTQTLFYTPQNWEKSLNMCNKRTTALQKIYI